MLKSLTLDQIAAATQGELLFGGENKTISGICTDTRHIQTGELFVALVAERDGHDFIPTALKGGAGCLLVSKSVENSPVPVIQVNNTERALGDLASFLRKKAQGPVIGLTGSNGKTSTKEMLHAIMNSHYKTLSTDGNFNNLLGLPLTLFRLQQEHEAVVLEMGMNAFGEIERLTEIAQPTIGLITNISSAHLEGLGSIEGVAKAKGELFQGLSHPSKAVVYADDFRVLQQSEQTNAERFFVTWEQDTKQKLQQEGKRVAFVEPNPSQKQSFTFHSWDGDSISVNIPLIGHHQCINASLAIAAALLAGVPKDNIAAALAQVENTGRRMKQKQASDGRFVLDDCYNSNPASCKAGIETLAELSGDAPTMAILGDMLEMGADSSKWHYEIGSVVGHCKIDFLCSFGDFSQEMLRGAQEAGLPISQTFATKDIDDCWAFVEKHQQPSMWTLVKGSRGMRLERISEKLLQQPKE